MSRRRFLMASSGGGGGDSSNLLARSGWVTLEFPYYNGDIEKVTLNRSMDSSKALLEMTMSVSHNPSVGVDMFYALDIDLTDYSTLTISYSALTNNSGSFDVSIANNAPTTWKDNPVNYGTQLVEGTSTTKIETDYVADISNYSGTKTILLRLRGLAFANFTETFEITKLEVA